MRGTRLWLVIAMIAALFATALVAGCGDDDDDDATTEETTARFEFAADETGATFECSLDGAEFAPCTSPKEYTDLAVGAHEFQVRAKDVARLLGWLEGEPGGR